MQAMARACMPSLALALAKTLIDVQITHVFGLTLLSLRCGLSAKVARNVWGRLSRGKTVALFKTVYSLPTSRSGSALPFDQTCPGRGTIQETKTSRPTQALKRTADALSTGSGRTMGVAVSQLGWQRRPARLGPKRCCRLKEVMMMSEREDHSAGTPQPVMLEENGSP